MIKHICVLLVILIAIVGGLFMSATGLLKNTATGTALVRCFCTLEDEFSCNDPYAWYFVPFLFQYFFYQLAKNAFLRDKIILFFDTYKAPGAYGDNYFRTLWIDSMVNEYKDKIDQFVVIGAGYDARCLRIQFDDDVKLFELDMRAIQDRKRKILLPFYEKILTHNITFIPATLGSDDWMGRLVSKHDFKGTSFFLLEGLLPYLEKSVVDDLFDKMSRLGDSVIVLATWPEEDVFVNPEKYYGTEKLIKFTESRGEYGRFGLNRRDADQYFGKFGFDVLEVVWSSEVSPFDDGRYRAIDGHNLALMIKRN